MCDLSYLASSSQHMVSRFTYVVTGVRVSFLFTANIPLYGYATLCVSIHEQLMGIWVVFTCLTNFWQRGKNDSREESYPFNRWCWSNWNL